MQSHFYLENSRACRLCAGRNTPRTTGANKVRRPDPSICSNLAHNLERLRKRDGISKKEIAAACNVAPSSVTGWFSGEGWMAAENFNALRSKFGWDFGELVKDPGIEVQERDLVGILSHLPPEALDEAMAKQRALVAKTKPKNS